MTRRQASTVASSPRSLAASSTSQAMSAGERSSWLSLALLRRRELMIVPLPVPKRTSVHRELDFVARVLLDGVGIAARPVEFENALGGRDIEPAELTFEIGQVAS